MVGAKHLYQFRVQQSTINKQQNTQLLFNRETFGILVVGEVNG
ncbi:hypothetical protein FJSC11DRAFT_2679 [Fischerella thermalis JSC-11]|uniref:Uncharacterized protein n=1 Tax=Fischerella thermalis JSC-11 TaxID=741277 RepID=G6FUY2_9CYAN|nr:hypothetical protein FJSC11DRAFT_2679 [Fischerella thermalis JSC-11]